jgi:hypothetical protein
MPPVSSNVATTGRWTGPIPAHWAVPNTPGAVTGGTAGAGGTPVWGNNPGGLPILPGGPTQLGSGAYGTVPTMPNPIFTAGQSISGNIGNLGGLYGLATGTGRASALGANQQLLTNLPGYAGLTTAASRNIASDLAGQVSPDVINLLQQTAAERGIGFGSDSPNTNAAFLRALGLTSMGLQAQGQNELTGAIGRTPTGPAFNPNQFLVDPGTMQGAQYGANVLRSAPNPTDAANAAIAAASAGFGRGQRSMPFSIPGGGAGPAFPPAQMGGGPAPPFALNSLSPDLTYSGASPAGYSNWADWARGIIGGGGGAPAGGGYMFTGPNTPNSPEDDAYAFSGGSMPGPAEVAPYDWGAGAGGATDYFSDGP